MTDPRSQRGGLKFAPEDIYQNRATICAWCAGSSELYGETRDMLEECLATLRRTHDDMLLDHEVEWTLNRLNAVALQIQDLLKRLPEQSA